MTVLDEIIAGVVEDLQLRRSSRPLADLMARVAELPPPADPLPALRGPGLGVIAEVKRSSPSKGQLADIPDPAALAAISAPCPFSASSEKREREPAPPSTRTLAPNVPNFLTVSGDTAKRGSSGPSAVTAMVTMTSSER